MQKSFSLVLAGVAMVILAGSSVGCGSKPGPDAAMTNAATGHWVGKSDSSMTLDIEASGALKLTKGDKETVGTWQSVEGGAIKGTLNGVTADMPFSRKDLNLTIKLPGDQNASEFTQM